MPSIIEHLEDLYLNILKNHERVVVALINEAGLAQEWNAAAAQFIKSETSAPPLISFLASSSHPYALDMMQEARTNGQATGALHFCANFNAMPISYFCHIQRMAPDCYLLFADPVPPLDDRSVVEYATLTNDLARTTRDLQKTQRQLEKRNAELENALAQIKTLRGLLPICASCKKIRDNEGYWTRVEEYLSRHSEVSFSHGLCPECVERLYPDMSQALAEKQRKREEERLKAKKAENAGGEQGA